MILRARLLIAATVVVMVVWLLAHLWWFDHLSGWSSFVLSVLAPVVLILGLLPLTSWATKRSALVAALDVRDGAFVAPPSHLHVAAHTAPRLALIMFLAGQSLRQFRAGDLLAVPPLLAATIAILVLAPSVLASVRNRPRIELRPNGLGLFDRINTHMVPWHAITVGPYPWIRPSTSGWAVNRISVAQPDLVRRGGPGRLRPKARNVSLPPLVASHPAFVAAAINHYLFHPQHREAIGTPQEYARLCQALAPHQTDRHQAARGLVND